MRLLPLITISAMVFGGCSAGAGMQATPPAPIPQTAGSIESAGYAPSPAASSETGTQDDSGADAPAPVSRSQQSQQSQQSQEEKTIPTGAGGRFLLD
jgi:hypothetical protein